MGGPIKCTCMQCRSLYSALSFDSQSYGIIPLSASDLAHACVCERDFPNAKGPLGGSFEANE